MNEALCSILCGEEEWWYDQDGRSISFNNDGTGELWCRCNLNYWIAAEIEWKSIKQVDRVEPSSQSVNTVSDAQSKNPRHLGQLNLQITLTKRLPQRARDSILSKSTIINELSLKDDAFQPKFYAVTIEKGNFIEPCRIGFSSSTASRFALRLLFDTSPYPPRSEWKNPEGGPDGGQFWDHREFVSRPSTELEKQGRAMNETSPTITGSCAVL
ncbi:hypothetical protein VFPPC_02201 [Pochonia chlamydosporia 170]|uniref:Uncharacterized protein n=1 Tax=Pochonia chlamydosporia 170 TaxID=1380566 RepID=A0A179F719_METCM|nr:hypothetical protein VFPPC_02201 [Pochonia chlamydosporia 170]OAQ61197.1 hypothetical protein VFPPC_02201 [Pochonia chlamydosporia 170]